MIDKKCFGSKCSQVDFPATVSAAETLLADDDDDVNDDIVAKNNNNYKLQH